MIRVLLVDDHTLFREGLKQIISEQSDIAVTGEAARSTVPFDRIVALELELYGSHGMQAHRYPELFALIEAGRLDPSLLVGRTTSLEEALPALTSEAAFAEPGITVIDRF